MQRWSELFYLMEQKCHIVWKGVPSKLTSNEAMQEHYTLFGTTFRMTMKKSMGFLINGMVIR